MTRVLLTNDDGWAAEGIGALREELLSAGMEVVTIAPDGNRSGVARRVSCHETVRVERVGGSDAAPVHACSGSPVDCVRVGVLADVLPAVDVVASGINHGVNVGDDATYSGTLGAALEGAMLGLPAVAFSQQDRARDLSMLSRGTHDFGLAWLAARIVGAVAARGAPPRTALNVNLPNELREPVVLVTRFGRITYDERWMRPLAPRGDGWEFHAYLDPDGPAPAFELDGDTDMAAVAGGSISLTPVTFDWAGETPRGERAAWAQGLADLAGGALRRAGDRARRPGRSPLPPPPR